jgi:hypothetical protein
VRVIEGLGDRHLAVRRFVGGVPPFSLGAHERGTAAGLVGPGRIAARPERQQSAARKVCARVMLVMVVQGTSIQ